MDSDMVYMCKQVILFACLSVTMIFAREVPLSQVNANLQSNGDQVKNEDEQRSGIFSAFKSFKNLPPGMPSVLLVTALTWVCDSPSCQNKWIWDKTFVYSQSWVPSLNSSSSSSFSFILVSCSYHGSRSCFTTQIGWDEKFTMGIQMDRRLRLMLMTEGSDKVHLVCYWTQ